MPKSYDKERIIIGLFIVARLIFCGYRAAHQSLTVDEAFTFNQFVDGPWNSVYGLYDPNNHVLYSWFEKLSVLIFGVSEFALRLPSVLAGCALMIGVAAVLGKLVQRAGIVALAVVSIGLHPTLLDFSIAARGYSLSMAAFVWAMYLAIRASYAVAGLLIGVAVSANLAIAFPALAFAGAWVVLGRGSWRARVLAASAMVASAVAVSGIVYSPMLAFILAHRDYFYIGYPSFRESLFGLILASIHARLEASTGIFGNVHSSQAIQWFFLPLIAGFIVVAAWPFANSGERVKLIPAATLAVTLVGLAAAHGILGLPYPAERTWLYAVVLFGMAWAIASDQAPRHGLLAVNLILASALALQFGTQLQTKYFEFWAMDRDMRQIAEMIQADSLREAPKSVAVSATWWHQPALEFYRRRLHIAALREVERLDPTRFSGYDYYVLSGADPYSPKREGLEVMFRDPEVGVVLARTPDSLARHW